MFKKNFEKSIKIQKDRWLKPSKYQGLRRKYKKIKKSEIKC